MIDIKSAMSPARWERVKGIFDIIVESPTSERPELVAKLCKDDSQLASEVAMLLSAEGDAASFLQANTKSMDAQIAGDEPVHGLRNGQLIANRFEIRQFIGRGGMGEVYKAWDNELHQMVALKTIRRDVALFPGALDRFKDEVKESLQITHPNVGRVYQLACHEQGQDQKIWFLTMELLEGPTVAQVLRENGRVSPRRAHSLIRNLVSGLACAHDAGIVHRDLKPGNLIIVNLDTTEEKLVVTDFGLAISLSAEQSSGASGTPAYMSPEQVEGARVGPPADIYALGLIICEMLTGARPILDPSSPEEFRRRLDGWLAAHREIPRRLRAIVRRCLRLSPDERFQHASEIARRLDDKPFAKTAAGIAAIVALAACLGVLLLRNRQSQAPPLDLAPVTTDPGLSWDPSLSPDGKWVAFSSDREGPGNLNIWIENLADKSIRQLTHDDAHDVTPVLSPDGKLVAYRSEREGGGIYVSPVAGGAPRLLAPLGRNPRFSPDGRSILFWTGDEHFVYDKFVPDGKVFVVPSGGGQPTQLMTKEFVDGRYPVWSRDGEFILLQASRSGGKSFDLASDLWVTRKDGSAPVSTGTFDLLRSKELVLDGCPFDWTGDELIFSARDKGSASLYGLPLSRGGRLKPLLTRLTAGSSDDDSPRASDGRLVIAGTNSNVNIWRVPLGSGVIMAPNGLVRATKIIGNDQDPSVSKDGSTLVFKRRSGKSQAITALWPGNDAGVELPIPTESDIVVSPDGTRVAYSPRSDSTSSIFIISTRGGEAREVCHKCGSVLDWAGDGDHLLYSSETKLSTLEMSSGERVDLLASSDSFVLREARLSPDGRWLAVTRTNGSNKSQVDILPLGPPGSSPGAIAVTDGRHRDQHPAWSLDGRSLFVYSDRDGFTCIWRFDLQPDTMVPLHAPQPVVHFHHANPSPWHLVITWWKIEVGGQSLFLNLGEVTGNIFETTLSEP